MAEVNHLGQPVGLPVDLALPRPAPRHVTLQGRYGAVVPLEAGHADALFAAYAAALPSPKPTRSTFGANGLALGAALEIECMAIKQ